MSWFASLFIAFLTAAAGTVASGYVASLSVDWYHVSGREGAAGYYVVSLGLLGLIVGGILGLVTSRIVGGSSNPSFYKALGLSLGVMVGLVGGIGGIARLLADVPPTIDGESLLLAVEIRWPAEQSASPATLPGEAYLRLHSVPAFSHTVRASVRGPLWKEDAKQVDGRWVAPGAVEIFTSRGSRMLEVNLGGDSTEGFLVPLPSHPGKKDLEWSDWLPRDGRGGPPRAKGLTYRYRAQRWSEPIRSQSFGPFEVLTIASQFYEVQSEGATTSAAVARFRLRYNGNAVPLIGDSASTEDAKVDEVALLPGEIWALLVHTDPDQSVGGCFLVVEQGARPRVSSISGCSGVNQAQPLTADPARYRAAKRVEPVRGRINRVTFAEPGVYLLGDAVFDTRTLAIHHFSSDSALTLVPAVPPLGLSPDGRSIVRFGYGQDENGLASEDRPRLGVTDVLSGQSYLLQIDPARMRYPTFDALDPAWLAHHFTWERGGDGVDRLVERKHFVPLPYFGVLSVYDGDDHNYRIEKAGSALREALIAFLVAEFRAERMPADSGAYEMPVRIDGRVVKVAASSDFGYVAVSMERDGGDGHLVDSIGERFNAALATGKYDSLFGAGGH